MLEQNISDMQVSMHGHGVHAKCHSTDGVCICVHALCAHARANTRVCAPTRSFAHARSYAHARSHAHARTRAQVPGTYELPLAAMRAAQSGECPRRVRVVRSPILSGFRVFLFAFFYWQVFGFRVCSDPCVCSFGTTLK